MVGIGEVKDEFEEMIKDEPDKDGEIAEQTDDVEEIAEGLIDGISAKFNQLK